MIEKIHKYTCNNCLKVIFEGKLNYPDQSFIKDKYSAILELQRLTFIGKGYDLDIGDCHFCDLNCLVEWISKTNKTE